MWVPSGRIAWYVTCQWGPNIVGYENCDHWCRYAPSRESQRSVSGSEESDTIRRLGPRGQRQGRVDGRSSWQRLELLGKTGQGAGPALHGPPRSRPPVIGHCTGQAMLSPVGVGSLLPDGGPGRLSSLCAGQKRVL